MLIIKNSKIYFKSQKSKHKIPLVFFCFLLWQSSNKSKNRSLLSKKINLNNIELPICVMIRYTTGQLMSLELEIPLQNKLHVFFVDSHIGSGVIPICISHTYDTCMIHGTTFKWECHSYMYMGSQTYNQLVSSLSPSTTSETEWEPGMQKVWRHCCTLLFNLPPTNFKYPFFA